MINFETEIIIIYGRNLSFAVGMLLGDKSTIN